MWITVIADASFCPDTGKAGYGYWIASQRGKLGGDGVLLDEPVNNVSAEMMALLMALHDARESGILHNNDAILLQTDCYPAIDAFQGARRNISAQERMLVRYFKEIVARYCIHIRFKHVKGHTENPEARFVTNKICDLRARKRMREARDAYRDTMIREFLYDSRTASNP